MTLDDGVSQNWIDIIEGNNYCFWGHIDIIIKDAQGKLKICSFPIVECEIIG